MDCGNCGGDCGHCTGCKGALMLTEGEMHILRRLGEIPFLPVARKADSMEPVYLEEELDSASLVLQCLEKKNLISIDYEPLKGFDYSAYAGYPVHGSFALTLRGQQVLELLDIQGIE